MIPLSPKAKQNITDEDISIFKANALEGLPRNRRRELQREMDSMEKALKTMTPNQLKLLDIISEQKANQKLDRVVEIIDRCISAQYIIKNPEATWEEINEYQNKISELIKEDDKKDYEVKRIYGGDNMSKEKIEKLEAQMRNRVVSLLEEGKNQKQALEILSIEFPKFSKAMLTNSFKRIKEAWKLEKEKTDVDKAVEYIFSEDKIKEDVAVKEENTECSEMKEVEVSNNKELDKLEVEKDSKEGKSKMSKLKVKVVEGEFGLYEVEGNVITSEKQDLSFGKLE